MNKKEFKEDLLELLNSPIDNVSCFDEKIKLIDDIILEYQKQNEIERNIENKGKEWKNQELKIILMDSPTKYNCMKYARLFNRGYGSIEQIYRWAATTDKEINESRKNNKFIKQIKEVAKEIGLVV